MTMQTIYVELLDEGVDAWRPVEAVAESEEIFRLPAERPEGENWRFAPGSRVRCEWRELDDGAALVAVEVAAE
ncbi:MAG TPA: hypothetical protein VGR11_08265 [Solirubrobacteraceae bacterium]|nr:hypothetical protein [Solirubrobacteraceae bacterium]